MPNALGAVGGLHFHGGIPLRVEVDDIIGGGQVQAHAARFKADEKERNRVIGLKFIHFFLPLLRLSVEMVITNQSLWDKYCCT